MRGSLKIQLALLLILLPVSVAVVQTTVAIKLFREDKELYVFDLSTQSVELMARNLTMALESLRIQAELRKEPIPPILAVRTTEQAPGEQGVFKVENISKEGDPRLQILTRGASGGLAIDVRPRSLLDLRGTSGPQNLMVVNEQGRVLVHPDPARVIERQSLLGVIQRIGVFSPRGSRVGSREVELNGKPTFVAYGRAAGHLAVLQVFPQQAVFEAANPLIKSAALTAAVVVAVAILLALLLGRMILRPLQLMARQAEAIGRGEFGASTPGQMPGDMGKLVASLNAMSAALKKREDEIKKIHDQLLQAERLNTAGRMISSITKELSAPLETSFSLASQTLKVLPPQHTLRLLQEQILGEMDRASNILQNFSRISSRDESEPREVEIDMELADVLASSGPLFEQRNLRVDTDLSLSETKALISPDQLRNALYDIFLFVAKEAQNTSPVRISSGRRDGDLIISIQYSGVPLGEEQRAQLLNPIHAEGQGQGSLLLAVAVMVLQEQGARMVIEQLDSGNRFNVILPQVR